MRLALLLTVFSCLGLGQDIEALANEARQAQERGDYRRAAAAYAKLAALDSSNPRLLSNLGVMQHLVGEDDKALETLRQALRLDPNLASASLFAGLSLVRLQRPREAIAYLERAQRVEESAMTNLGLARAYVALRDFRRANEYYHRAAQRDLSNSEAWFGAGITYRHLLNATALQIGLRAAASPEVKSRLAAVRPGSDRAAVFTAEEEVARQPDNLDALVRLAQVYQGLALSTLQRAVHLDPDSARSHLALAEALAENQDLQAAVPEYEAAIRAAPALPATYLGLATAYWRAGGADHAFGPLQQVLKLSPDDPEAHGILADLLVRRGQYAEAKAHAARALRTNPDLAAARVALAKAYLAEDRPADAAEELKKTLAADLDGTFHYLLYQALRQLGRDREASDALRVFRARHAIFRKDADDTVRKDSRSADH